MLNLSHLKDIEISDIDTSDYPDFVDAYIEYACLVVETPLPRQSRKLTDDELDWVNEQDEWIHEQVMSTLDA